VKSLDTSVAVDHLRGLSAATELLTGLIGEGETLVVSEVVRFELLAGVREDERADLERFFSALSWFAVDETITRMAGALARQYRRAHNGIDDADYLIAATALVLEAELLTMNVRHFPMLTGLQPAY
jgi:hypothetical protein